MFSCYLCGDDTCEVLATREDIRFNCFGYNKQVLRCRNCGLVQLFPQWSEKDLDELYSNYWKQNKDFKGQNRKVKISRYLTNVIRKGDKILEIGCGHGDNIGFLKNRGYKVIGIDKDLLVCDGETVINSDVRDYKPKQKPDFIYAIHLFEHLVDPRNFIKWMLDTLSDNGRFVLEIPNVDEPLLTLYKNKKFQKFYWYPYHLFFFSPQTAQRLFSEYSIDVSFQIKQEYGLLNHLRWLIFGRPGNLNYHIPVLDDIYKFILTKVIKIGDTLTITGTKCSI